MTIRPFVNTDVEACAALYVKTYNSSPWNYHWELSTAINYLNDYVSCPQFIGFVLTDEEKVIGVMFAHTKIWWTNDQLFIDELYIDPDKQKMGCGKKLIQHAEQYAMDNGLETLTLITNQFMPAMQFYEKSDFIHAQPFVIMFKQI